MKKVYVASSLDNIEQVVFIMNKFKNDGMIITYDWTTHGRLTNPELLKEAGINELVGVLEADMLFMIQPARAGSHVELGAALALLALNGDITVIIVKDGKSEEKPFYFINKDDLLDRMGNTSLYDNNIHIFNNIDVAYDAAIHLLKEKQ